jgi:hypothetical protein
MNYMRENIWFPEAEMMKSAIAGVKAADNEAKIVLHIAGLGISPDNVFVKTFFYTMIERDVDFDYAGLSYPYRDYHPTEKPYFLSQEFRDTITYLTTLQKKVIISEFGYPNSPVGIEGDPDPGYPYTPIGQATWIRDFLNACFEENHIERAFYFYPEYFPGLSYGSTINLESSGLFVDDTHLQPAVYEFRRWCCLNPADFENDGDVDITDLGTLSMYWLSPDCNYPHWCEGTDLNYSGRVDFLDLALFAKNWLWEKIPADIDINGIIDFIDYAIWAAHWTEQNCTEPDWCAATDLNHNGQVDIFDLAEMAQNWLAGK